jgi:pimeloyl-ACP methyl ester carboxylesterase
MSYQIPLDQYLMVGSTNTCYWSLGSNGSPIILIHGLGGFKEMWRSNISSLAGHHRVYAMDLIGFGLSEKPSIAYSLTLFTQFLCSFMEELNITQASLVGNSLGGAIALDFAIQYPDKVDKLVLVDSAGLGREIHPLFRLVSLPILGELLMRPSRRNARQGLQICFHNPGRMPDELVNIAYHRLTLPGAQEAELSSVRALYNFWGQRDDFVQHVVNSLHKISAPTLIIWGKEDRFLPVFHSEIARKRISNAQSVVFEHCGHTPQMECTEKFNDTILKFLHTSE